MCIINCAPSLMQIIILPVASFLQDDVYTYDTNNKCQL